MTDLAELGIKIEAKDIKNAVAQLDRLEKQSKESEGATQKLSGAWKALGGVMAAVGAGALASKVIANTIAQEKAVAQLEAALLSTSGAVGLTSKELQGMASQLQATSTFGDEAVISMQSVLLTFTKIGGETFPRATQAIADMAARMGTDLQSAAIQVGKALNDPIANLSALSRAGVQFTKDQQEMIKGMAETGEMAEAQAVILKELETQFGGSAEAARNTLGGALESLSNAFGDLLENDKGISGTSDALNELTGILQDPAVKEGFQVLTTAVIDLVGLAAKGVTAFTELGQAIGDMAGRALGPSDMLEQMEGRLKRLRDAASDPTPLSKWLLSDDDKSFIEAAGGMDAAIDKMGQLVSATRTERAQEPVAPSVIAPAVEAAQKLSDEERREMLDPALGSENFDDDLAFLIEQERRKQEALKAERDAWNDQMLEDEQFIADSLREIDEENASSREKIQKNLFGALNSIMDSGNRELFSIGKTAALAKAAFELPSAVLSSFEKAGGYPWGIPAAAAMAIAGGQQIAKISSASFGGGAGSSAPAPIAAPSTPQAPPPPQGAQSSQREASIVVSGGLHSDEDVRNLIGRMNEVNEDMGADFAFVAG